MFLNYLWIYIKRQRQGICYGVLIVWEYILPVPSNSKGYNKSPFHDVML